MVDDDSDLCAILWDLFRERGYRVGIANDVQSAIQHLQVGDFRVVLIDMHFRTAIAPKYFVPCGTSSGTNAQTILITGHAASWLSPWGD